MTSLAAFSGAYAQSFELFQEFWSDASDRYRAEVSAFLTQHPEAPIIQFDDGGFCEDGDLTAEEYRLTLSLRYGQGRYLVSPSAVINGMDIFDPLAIDRALPAYTPMIGQPQAVEVVELSGRQSDSDLFMMQVGVLNNSAQVAMVSVSLINVVDRYPLFVQNSRNCFTNVMQSQEVELAPNSSSSFGFNFRVNQSARTNLAQNRMIALVRTSDGAVVGTRVANYPYDGQGQGGHAPGDCNCDGLLNNGDIEPFIMALLNPGDYISRYPNCNINSADVNRDGRRNNFDIDPFVALIFP